MHGLLPDQAHRRAALGHRGRTATATTQSREAAQFAAAWKAGEGRLAGLLSNSHLITAAGAGRIIWKGSPELVLSSVADALTP